MPWTKFMDMHSGGGQKLDWSHIYIEAPEDEARRVFYARFGRNADNVTCACCGSDYSVSESKTLEDATGFDRGLRAYRGKFNEATREWEYPAGRCYLEPDEVPAEGWELSTSFRDGNGITLAEFIANGGNSERGMMGCTAKFIYATGITEAERNGPKGRRREKVWSEVDE